MRTTLQTTGALLVFLMAALAPVAVADGGEHDDNDRDDRDGDDSRRWGERFDRDRDHDDREGRDDDDHDDDDRDDRKEWLGSHGDCSAKSDFALNLAGSGTDRQNRTYTFTLKGEGTEREYADDGGLVGLAGKGTMHVVVTAADGAVVKERDLKVRFVASDIDGDGTWTLASKDRAWDWTPVLVLHGTATKSASGLDLDGEGTASFRMTQLGPLRLKLDVEGTLSMPAPPPVVTSSTTTSSVSA